MVDIERDTATQELLELARENNKLLKKMHRSQQWATIFRVLYWVVIIGALAGSVYFLQPFLGQAMTIYQGLLGTSESLQDIEGGLPDLTGLFGRVEEQQ